MQEGRLMAPVFSVFPLMDVTGFLPVELIEFVI